MESQRLTESGSLAAASGQPAKKPTKAVWLALGLFLLGLLLILIGVILYFTDPEAHGTPAKFRTTVPRARPGSSLNKR